MKTIPFREQVMLDRLRELGTQASGLHAEVVTSLRHMVEKEADAIQSQELKEHVEIEQRYQDKLRKRVARLVTHRAISRAFAAIPTSSAAKTPAAPTAPVSGEGGAA